MVKLKNIGADDVSLWAPPGEDDAQLVEHAQVVDVPGELADDAEQPDDAYVVILPGGDRRAFPRSRWQLVTGPAPSSSSIGRREGAGRE